MAPSLTSLPDEIRENILGHLLPQEYKRNWAQVLGSGDRDGFKQQAYLVKNLLALRSVDKFLRDYLTKPFEDIFETVAVSCHDRSLRCLVEISQHEPTAKLVNSIHVSVAGYLQDELKSRRKSRATNSNDTVQLDRYEAALDRQSVILESGLVGFRLGVAFQSLRNCTSVAISQCYKSPELDGISPERFTLHNAGNVWYQRVTRIVSAVASGLNNTSSVVRELTIRCAYRKSYYSIAPLTFSYAGITFIDNVFANLRTLDLHLNTESNLQAEAFDLALSLGRCQMSEEFHLKLSQFPFADEDSVNVVYTEIFRSAHFPKLRTLKLEQGVLCPQQLTKFLDRHRHTLEFLQCHNVNIIEEPLSWIEVMRFVSEKLTLEGFVVYTGWPEEKDFDITWEGCTDPWIPNELSIDLRSNIRQQLRHISQTWSMIDPS